MTIPASPRRMPAVVTNGVTTVFTFDFKVFADADVEVVFVSAAGVESILVLGTQYVVARNVNQTTSPGGTITTLSPLASGGKLTIIGALAYTQSVDVPNAGPFFGDTIENGLDYLAILIQQAVELIGRSLKVSPVDGDIPSLPSVSVRANKSLGFDAFGNPVALAVTPYGPVNAGDIVGQLNGGQLADGIVTVPKLAAGFTLPIANGGTGAASFATAGLAQLGVAQTFTATQVADNGTASVSTTSTYTFDGADQIRAITLTGAITVTFGAPTGITPNAFYVFRLAAGDTSARAFAWNAAYKFPAATAPLTSGTVTNGASDIITFIGGAANTLLYVGHQADVR